MKELEQYRLNAAAHLRIARQEQAREIRVLQEQIASIAAEIEAQRIAYERAIQPLPEGTICPRCWIWDAKQIELKCVPSDGHHDVFKCPTCKEHISVEP